ncbi:hypothetical protein RVBP16_2760 [Pseudomonas phage sp. 30-2]|nr:hypothetical protein RVBP16_2760 [Pseudomonas phage sp. 30-2]
MNKLCETDRINIIKLHFDDLKSVSELKQIYGVSYDVIKTIIRDETNRLPLQETDIKILKFKKLVSKELLFDLHVIKKQSFNEIRKTYKINELHLKQVFNDYGIPIEKCLYTATNKKRKTKKPEDFTKDFFEHLVYNERRTISWIKNNYNFNFEELKHHLTHLKIDYTNSLPPAVKHQQDKISRETLAEELKIKSIVDIINEYGISRTYVESVIKEYNIQYFTKPKHSILSGKESEIYRMYYDECMTTYQIAEKLGVCQYTIWKIMADNGWKTREPIKKIDLIWNDIKEEVVKLIDNGYTLAALCEKYEITSITEKLIEEGIKYTKGNISSGHAEISEYVRSLGFNVIDNDRTIIFPREIDIFIPELNIGIEYNGLYFHSTRTEGNVTKHREKYSICKQKGIRLIQIFEDEFIHKKELVKRKLAHILGKSNNKCYARNCIVKEISVADKRNFFKKYHIQEDSASSYAYGLYYDNELVCAMSFLKKKKCTELVRYASSMHVIGGFSKLLKYCINNNKIDVINTYADLRWSNPTNNVYVNNGFDILYETDFNYTYVSKEDFSKRLNRQKFMKHKLKNILSDFDKSLTEEENMKNNGFYRVYDAGHLKLQYKVNK